MIATTGFLIAAALAAAAPAPPPAPPPAAPPSESGFSDLWTPWTGVNRDALRAETARPAPGAAAGPLRAGSVELGQRVGEIVRAGDCEAGERLAREAGDFPLVEAVRSHCRGAIQAVSRR